MTTIDMQTMRYINLLDKASKVKTRKCFIYNNTIVFAVPRELVSKAIGPDASHVRIMRERLGKNVKIITEPNGIRDAHEFVEEVVSPVKFKSLESIDGVLVISSGGPHIKAALLGRNKKRFEELKTIVSDNFGLDLRIV